MKSLKKIYIYFFILLILQSKEEHKRNERRLYIIEGIVGAFALSGAILFKYVRDPIKTFENDENWEERFLNYVEEEELMPTGEDPVAKSEDEIRRASITFKFVNLIKDNFGSDLTNDCIKTIKKSNVDKIKAIN